MKIRDAAKIQIKNMRLKKTKGYNWRFFKAGGAYQPLIERGSDIAAVGELDMKLWAALSCPTRGLYFDEKTLDFMDADKDGRIRLSPKAPTA